MHTNKNWRITGDNSTAYYLLVRHIVCFIRSVLFRRNICGTSWLSVSKWLRTKGGRAGLCTIIWHRNTGGRCHWVTGTRMWTTRIWPSQIRVRCHVVSGSSRLELSLTSTWHPSQHQPGPVAWSESNIHTTISLPQISSVPRKLFTASLKSISRYSLENISIST